MTRSVAYYNGFRLVETTAITKIVQRRTHSKRRINKKWLKRYGYKTVLDNETIYRFGDCILATPNTIRKIIEKMKGEQHAETHE